ncbi:MAG: hypothetical protein SFY80_05385 [Verrucomicrobiota bacterium]|nr:hypothetical protein [Verrucomicrobiota bacterium]
MNKLLILTSAFFAHLIAAASSHAAIITTTGVYDENIVVTNTVDSSLTAYTVAQFSSDVATAFSNNRGGVIGFNGFSTNTVIPSIEAPYGLNATKSLNITFNGGISHHIVLGLGSSAPISGQTSPSSSSTAFGQGPNSDGDANYDIDMQFASITGGEPLEVITGLGLTYLGRTNGGGLDNLDNVTITAFFSNSTSSSVTTNANNVGGERFIGFQSPANTSIDRLLIDLPADIGRRVFIDDLAFITTAVPEPSTYAAVFGFLAMVVALIVRRK